MWFSRLGLISVIGSLLYCLFPILIPKLTHFPVLICLIIAVILIVSIDIGQIFILNKYTKNISNYYNLSLKNYDSIGKNYISFDVSAVLSKFITVMIFVSEALIDGSIIMFYIELIVFSGVNSLANIFISAKLQQYQSRVITDDSQQQ